MYIIIDFICFPSRTYKIYQNVPRPKVPTSHFSDFAKEIFGYVRFYGYLCITYISPGEALFRRQYVIILNPTHYNKTDK